MVGFPPRLVYTPMNVRTHRFLGEDTPGQVQFWWSAIVTKEDSPFPWSYIGRVDDVSETSNNATLFIEHSGKSTT